MKKSIAIVLIALMVFASVACGSGSKNSNKADPAIDVVGTWVLDSGVGEEAAQYVELMKAFGMKMSIEFNNDGTGKFNTAFEEEIDSEEFKYEIKGDSIVILGVEESAGSIKLENGDLIMETDGMTLVFKKN